MSVTEPRSLTRFRVWVIPPSVAGTERYFPWISTGFVEEQRLIPERISPRAYGCGSASFRVVRELREEDGAPIYDRGNVYIGAYVAVTVGVDEYDEDAVIFIGTLSSLNLTAIQGQEDRVGSASAQGLGLLMDGTRLSQFQQASSGGAPSEIRNPPTFNLQGDGGEIIGNRVLDNSSLPVFAKLPSECSASNLFSRWDVLRHVLAYCAPSAFPSISISAPAAVQAYLQGTTQREVLKLSHLTLKGAVDILISRTQGFGWDIRPVGSGWTLYVFPMVDSTEYDTDFPAATPEDIDIRDSASVSVTFSEDAGDQYDSVTVLGNPIVFGVTLSVADGNLLGGWTATQLTDYKLGAQDGAGYDDLSRDNKVVRNEQHRSAPGLADVFQLYRLKTATDPVYYADPGTGGAAVGPLIPEVLWSGTTATVAVSSSRTPYLPGLRFARFVPWPDGKEGDGGTDYRDATAKAGPSYLTPRVFKYEETPADTEENQCVDLLVPDKGRSRSAPSVTPDDQSPSVRIKFNPPEIPAKADWVDLDDGVTRLDSVQDNAKGSTFDYRKICVTVGIESSQRVSVTKVRTGVPTTAVRRDLIVEDDTLHCWVMREGALVGAGLLGEGERVPGPDQFIRNDFATCERLAATLASFAFRKRSSVSITLAEPDSLPTWAAIGTMIGEITEESAYGPYPATVVDAFTVVESIDYDLTGDHPRVTVSTTLPQPSRGWTASPSGGGSVSQSLGGTPAQAISEAQFDGLKTSQKTSRVPTFSGQDIPGNDPALLLVVDRGNTLETGQLGVKYYSGTLASVPSAYDPDVTSSFIDGIGRGTLYKNGIADPGYVLIVNDNRGSFRNALFSGDPIRTSGAVSIPVSGGGSVRAYTAGT